MIYKVYLFLFERSYINIYVMASTFKTMPSLYQGLHSLLEWTATQ